MTVAVRQSYMISFGKMTISRGTGVIFDDDDNCIGQIKLYSWDVLPHCRHEDCPAHEHCSYYNGMNTQERCMIIGSYLKKLVDVVLGNIGERMTELQLFRFGTSLIPLYKNLARLKIEEAGLVTPMVQSKMGNQIPNPLYKEIREHIKMIDIGWKTLNFQMIDEKFNLPTPDLEFDGDLSYYDQMEKEIAGEGKATKGDWKMYNLSKKESIKANPKLRIRKSIYRAADIPNEAKDSRIQAAAKRMHRKRKDAKNAAK